MKIGTSAYDHGDFREALRNFYIASALGSAEADFRVAQMYEEGEGVRADVSKAIGWYRQAVEKGSQAARTRLGEILYDGLGVKPDRPAAIALWRVASDAGSSEASYLLALDCLGSGEKPRDPTLAALYARRAAEAGLPAAEGLVGSLYEGGIGVEKDERKAIEWYARAADHGDTVAQGILAGRYMTGQGVPRDVKKGETLYEVAIAGGSSSAKCELGAHYLIGTVPGKGRREGERLIDEAAEEGYATAQLFRGQRLLSVEPSPDYVGAVKWLQKASDQGVGKAKLLLALLLLDGRGTDKDPSMAKTLLREAERQDVKGASRILATAILRDEAETSAARRDAFERLRQKAKEGDTGAQLEVGSALWHGKGIAQDYTQAVEWYRRAAEAGDREAQNDLGNAYDEGLGVVQNYAAALEWYRKSARAGYPVAYWSLGTMFEHGRGVRKDLPMAYAWLSLAVAEGVRDARGDRDRVGEQLSQAELADAQTFPDRLKSDPSWVRDVHAAPPEVAQLSDQRPTDMKPSVREDGTERTTLRSSGTAFFVSQDGHAITSARAVEGCGAVLVGEARGKVMARDEAADLALLMFPEGSKSAATFRAGAPVGTGDTIVVVGYPLAGTSGTGVSVSTGSITAPVGPREDPRRIQISAPVQPGGSGAPVLDRSGNVVGVVGGALGTAALTKASGATRENLILAVSGESIREFLARAGVSQRRVVSGRLLDAGAIKREAEKYTIRIECR